MIAALAAELGTQLRTVTLAFNEYVGTPDDEAPLAEAAARLLRSDHVTVRIGRDEFEELLDDFLESHGSADDRRAEHLSHQPRGSKAGPQSCALRFGRRRTVWRISILSSDTQAPEVGTRIFAVPSHWAVRLQASLRTMPCRVVPPKTAGLLSHSGDIAQCLLLRRALSSRETSLMRCSMKAG